LSNFITDKRVYIVSRRVGYFIHNLYNVCSSSVLSLILSILLFVVTTFDNETNTNQLKSQHREAPKFKNFKPTSNYDIAFFDKRY